MIKLIKNLIKKRYRLFSNKSIKQVYNLDNDFTTIEDYIINAYILYTQK